MVTLFLPMQRYYNAEEEGPYFVILQKEVSKMQNKSQQNMQLEYLFLQLV